MGGLPGQTAASTWNGYEKRDFTFGGKKVPAGTYALDDADPTKTMRRVLFEDADDFFKAIVVGIRIVVEKHDDVA